MVSHNKKQLIDFGKELLKKGRSPSEIYNAVKIQTNDPRMLQNVLEGIYATKQKIKNRTPEELKILLEANKIELNHTYSISNLLRIPIIILVLGGIVYFFSDHRINNNAFFGWVTLTQGIVILFFYLIVKIKKQYNLLLLAVIAYFSIWLIEILLFGKPNDLLDAYKNHRVHYPPKLSLKINLEAAKFIGYIAPYLYLLIKGTIGWKIIINYTYYKRYNNLSQVIKKEIGTLL